MPEDHEVGDEEIAIRCQLGERGAFDVLVARWAGPLAAYARRMTPDSDAASELTQDIWLRVLRGLPRLREPARFRSWLFGIAHRSFADTLRSRYATARHVADGEDLSSHTTTADDDMILRADRHRIEHALSTLPPIEREVVTLFYLQELSLDEAATSLSVPVGTVKSRLHRARRLLRGIFEHQGAVT